MNYSGLEIAIIGLAGRFPGASTLEEFWQNLQQGVESIQSFSDAELQAQGVEASLLQQPQYVSAGAVLDGIDQFDADFFGFSPREAEILDPQQRLFLECAWEALENAGYDAERYSGAIGVYAGAAINSYLLNLFSHPDLQQQLGRYQLFLASDKDFLTTRVSYKLNLRGPSVDVQTACSTSLVAVHIAAQSLLGGECDMALAGGVALSQQTGYLYQAGGIYSPDGHCRAFDAEAAGTVAGSGLGIVVLKRLEDALADGDLIHAVIKGSAINNDGAQKVSYTAPSITAQAEVIRAAHRVAEVEPASISYVETHGTGTSLGDPIEVAALSEAFQSSTALPPQTCAIGSLKPNIGHLDTAAGIASLIKTVLALQHRQIPPSLHFQQPNPQIPFEQTPFYVNAQLADWRSSKLPLRAGVSSFGIGGTNAHIVLEAAPAPIASGPSRPWQILSLSAKTVTALNCATDRLRSHLQQHPDLNLADVAYSLHSRRAFPHRRTLLCQTQQEAIQTLELSKSTRLLSQIAPSSTPAVTFLFPGQGSQYAHMGRDLYDQEPAFRATIDQCANLLQPHLNRDLRELLYPAPAAASELLSQTQYAQPTLFAVEYALAELWRSWGVQPTAMIGHSIGEYVAATVAGVFALEAALRLVALRGQLMQACPTGAMLAVSLSASQTEALIQPWAEELALAAENAPELCVVSGNEAAILALQNQLEQRQIHSRRLHVSHAFHSQMMQSVLQPFGAALRQTQLRPPQMPLISNVTGSWLTASEATDPNYWLTHLRQPVRFAAGIATLQQPDRLWLEVGPGRTLSQMVQAQMVQAQIVQAQLVQAQMVQAQLANAHPCTATLSSLSSAQEKRSEQSEQSAFASDQALMLHSLSRLWLAGVSIDWAQFYAAESRHRLPLPTYPFERQRYWVDLPPNDAGDHAAQRQNSSVTLENASALNFQPNSQPQLYLLTWERTLPLMFDPNRLAAEPHCWLICLDSTGIAAAVAQQLADAGQDVFTVAIGEQFTQLGYRAFALNPQQPADYLALQQDLQQRDLLPDRILYGWGLEHVTPAPLLFLTRAFATATTPTQLTLLTAHTQDVTGEEALNPVFAAVLGLAQVIGQEYPHWCCRQIDLGLAVLAASFQSPLQSSLTESLLMELVSTATSADRMIADRIIAYRGNHRWRQQFAPLEPQSDSQPRQIWRPHGHYLIVGDCMPGLGQVWAKSLAALNAKLTLICDRQKAPEQQPFSSWLEALGATCLLYTADMTDVDQMQAAIATSEAKLGQIHGVFYATPMSNEQSMGLLCDLNAAAWQQKWDYCERTKIAGLNTLNAIFSDRSLDFCLLQSSLSSIVGGLGLGAYAAANRAIDAFAQSQRSRHWISINWDAYAPQADHPQANDPQANDPQADHPPATPPQPTSSFGSGLTTIALSADQVWTATELALSSGCSGQIIVSRTNLRSRIQQAFLPTPTRPPTAQSRANLSCDYVAPSSEIEQTIVQQWQQLLGIEPIGVNDSFFELGGHSLLAIQAIAQLRQAFQVELPISSLLIEAPTIAEIAALVTQQLDQQSAQPNNLAALTDILTEIQSLSPEAVQKELTS